MKIYVYAICKNEQANINKWVESMSEADGIYVLDTGSTDKSVKLLKSLKVHVKREIISPWRFDVARNKSFEFAAKDGDLYVCTDLDETFEKGWRQKLEEKFDKKYTRVSYTYNWSFKEDGSIGTSFMLNKIHNKDYTWTHPVHEVLTPLKKECQLTIKEIVLNHHQLAKEERKNYLPLLELSVKEDPLDDRNMHYLAREYMYYKMYDKAILHFHKHLNLEKATWKEERCASMRFMARCYQGLDYLDEANMWLEKAIKEAPFLREPYVEYAYLLFNKGLYARALDNLDKAFKITEKSDSYINEEFAWDWQIYDLYSLCAYYANKKDIAKYYNKIAISLNPSDERLRTNALFFE